MCCRSWSGSGSAPPPAPRRRSARACCDYFRGDPREGRFAPGRAAPPPEVRRIIPSFREDLSLTKTWSQNTSPAEYLVREDLSLENTLLDKKTPPLENTSSDKASVSRRHFPGDDAQEPWPQGQGAYLFGLVRSTPHAGGRPKRVRSEARAEQLSFTVMIRPARGGFTTKL